MQCDNPGCGKKVVVVVTTADKKKKHICHECYIREGWDKPGAGTVVPYLDVAGDEEPQIKEKPQPVIKPQTVPAEFRKLYSLKSTGRRDWIYNEEAAIQLQNVLEKYGSWAMVAKTLGIRSGELHRYRKGLTDRGFGNFIEGTTVAAGQPGSIAESEAKMTAGEMAAELIRRAKIRRDELQAVIDRMDEAIIALEKVAEFLDEE